MPRGRGNANRLGLAGRGQAKEVAAHARVWGLRDEIALALIAAVVPGTLALIGDVILTWRVWIAARAAVKQAEFAATHAADAVTQARKAATAATDQGERNAAAIENVHQSVNGGLSAAKKEIVELKAEVKQLKAEARGR